MTRRRLLRLVGIALASLLVGALLAALLLRLRFDRRLAAAEERFRNEVGPLELATYAPPEVDDPENVAAWLRAGSAAILIADEDWRLLGELHGRPPSEWSERERQEAEALLAGLEPALVLLHRAGELTDSSFGLQYAAGPSMPIPSVGGTELLRASTLLAVEARLALGQGDLDRALTAARSVERLAAALGHEPIVLFQILKGAVLRRYLRLARSLLEAAPPEAVLAELAADLDHLETQCAPMSRALAFEAAGMHAGWSGRLEGGHGEYRLPGALHLFEPLILARTLEGFLLFVEVSETPGSLERLPSKRPQRVAPWDPFSLIAGSYVDLLTRDKLTRSALELARLAVELRRAAVADGSYPDSLGELDRPPAPSPLAGEAPLYEPSEDGGARLAYPEALRRWEEASERETPGEELLQWELPPPGR